MKMSISDNIRLIRESKGYSQEYVSKKLKVTQQAYSQMEKKPDNMTLERLRNLAAILDVSLIMLIGEENTYLQHNFNQQGGQAATQMVFNQESKETSHLYERFIKELKDEVAFLRSKLT
jgi:transcriptional regulator with XRE-family HTH domain